MNIIKKIPTILCTTGALLLTSLTANHSHAETYIGVDAANFSYEVGYANGTEKFDFSPKRVRFGYLGDSGFGVELQVLTSSKDQITRTNNVLLEGSMDSSWGASFIMASKGERFGYHGSLGMLMLNTEYYAPNFNTRNAETSEFFGLSFGAHYNMLENLQLSLDYHQYKGQASYLDFFTSSGSALGDFLDVKLKGYSLGLTYFY